MNNEEVMQWAIEQQNKIINKMRMVSLKHKEGIPYTTDAEGNYDDRSDKNVDYPIDDGINWWTNGFWGGMQWLLYIHTREKLHKEIAVSCEKKLESCFDVYYGLHHDVGFMYMPTAVYDYKITGNMEARKLALKAADFLAGRFNVNGNFIRAWNDLPNEDTRGWAIIDCMLNLSLLYWASEETNDPRYKNIAIKHADTVMKNFIRKDGSSIHIGRFDPESGEFLGNIAGQGYDIDSSWTRGQGWAIYGFVISYLHTGKREYLVTAKKVADYCINMIPQNFIIPVDFCQPREPYYEDSCAAVVIACGLIALSRELEAIESDIYLETAVKLLRAVAESRSDWSENCDAIVLNCSASYHTDRHHITMIYADYYFLKALSMLSGVINKEYDI